MLYRRNGFSAIHGPHTNSKVINTHIETANLYFVRLWWVHIGSSRGSSGQQEGSCNILKKINLQNVLFRDEKSLGILGVN